MIHDRVERGCDASEELFCAEFIPFEELDP
jgi:hypothetical protein